MAPALETIGLSKHFGGLAATSAVSFRLEQGARHALIGPNGAGKTTFINLLTGVLSPSEGQILLEGADITTLAPDARVRRGLARTFQINQLFGALTPLETIGLAVSERLGGGADWWRRFGARPALVAETLEIAVAFACRPRVLLLAAPAAGVPEAERHDLLATVAALPRDVSVLLIEHDMDLVFSFAERISVLVQGALFREGPAAEIASDPAVRAVYLGEGGDA
jgi:branched-chain amino acid transport system ATP-binding protein